MREEIIRLQAFVDDLLAGSSELAILEAGCGFGSYMRFKQKTRTTGIDISEKQLQRNATLQSKVLGDVQHCCFEPSVFDVIVCWDVLEHLPHPELALDNFARSVKEKGVIILAMPNLLSVKGLVTKYTPHWFHVQFYRLVRGKRDAGTDDSGPFKTYLKSSITPNAIIQFSLARRLKVVYFETYDADLSRVNKPVHILYKMLSYLAKLLSLGKLGNSEMLVVLQK